MHPLRPHRPRALALVLLLALPLGGAGVRFASAGPAVPSDPIFVALLTDGTTVAGRLTQVDPKVGLTLTPAEGPEQVIAVARLVKLTRSVAVPTQAGPEGATVLLAGDDRLARCQVGAATDTTVRVINPALGPFAVPLDALVGLIFQRANDPSAADALEARVRTEERAAERVWLHNGDRLDGLFAGLSERELQFQPPTGKVALPRAGIVALGFDPKQVADHPPVGPFGEFALLDGSRLTLGWDRLRFERGQIVGLSRSGIEVRIPVGEVVRVRIGGSSVRYLSDRDADRAGYQSYLGPTRPYVRNRSVTGSPLRLAGQVFDRGLGTQSRTLLAYRLDADDQRFQATVGLDEAAGPLGNVRFRILVDNKVAFESPLMGAGDPPQGVDIPIGGGRVLVLITEFGERGDVQDNADWVEARVIRNPADVAPPGAPAATPAKP